MLRRPAPRVKPRTSQMKSFAAPVGGWVANRNLAQPTGQGIPPGAAVLRNFFPQATGAVMRRGSGLYATLGLGDQPVTALFTYLNGAQDELFGATPTTIYNITSIITSVNYDLGTDLDDTIETDEMDTFGENSTIGMEVLEGQTGGDWVVVQFATGGGTFLRGVNGVDTPFVYDGTTFSTTPALTFEVGETTVASDMSYVWAFKGRLFFIERESLDAWYLPVDSIGGELVKFPMGGVFNEGGSLVFGASWSLDAGNGLQATCVFVTSEGEVAVYEGTDPSVAADWRRVGVYKIGRPLGPQAFIRAGGDLVIATSIGFVPLSQAIQRDYAALSPSAVSFPIETAWNRAVELRTEPWHVKVWPSKQMVVVALPTMNEESPAMYVANTRTGAWAEFTNWDGNCLEVFRERLFFGSENGRVVEANVTGLDEGQPFTASCVPLFEDLRTPGSLKIGKMARAVIRSAFPVGDQVSMQVDFEVDLPSVPDALPVPFGNQWGVGIWGTSTWGVVGTPRIQQDWQSIAGAGYALSPSVQITSGSVAPLDAELVRVDMTYTTADIVS